MTDKDNQILWAKVKSDAIIPSKRNEDAGYDIYPCFEESYIIIPPHETVMIPTGIASAFSNNYVAVLKERGSTGTKGIAQRSGIIDSGFRNEWLCPVTNTTDGWLIISKLSEEELFNRYELSDEVGIKYISYKNDRIYRYGTLKIIYPSSKAICQALILPVPKMITKEVSYEELQTIPSKRGLGMLGSSNK